MAIDIRPELQDSLLRVTSRPCHHFAMGVFWTPLRHPPPVRLSVTVPFPTMAIASLGDLSALPTEIVLAICSAMDVTSLFRFRQVNRRARAIVSDMSQYREIAIFAIETLHALLFTRMGSHFNFTQFYDAFRAMECQVCGLFGHLLFLPNLQRCCWKCLRSARTHQQLHVVALADLAKFYPLSEDDLGRILPVVHAAPGIYSEHREIVNEPKKLVSLSDAMRTLGKLGFDPQSFLQRDTNYYTTGCMATTAFPYHDRATGTIEHGTLCRGCDVALNNGSIGAEARLNRAYTTKQFLEHFQSCPEAQNIWRDSREGTIPFENLNVAQTLRSIPWGW
ncbi:hypothetical protein C8A03DRAFT_35470 [Achaetomium macrosporum]|uniref:F-box domain-containing protein n=1 Tax=Achaetomium macrosporum TaxID=79813 RepID=A0AAN7HDZ7_9PEZI|nr:hypothetical protein C8A03DRAFT_35470 [Achaetomium macrosporum]